MENFASQYQEHIKTLQQRIQNVLKNNKLNALLIHSGEPKSIFLDDFIHSKLIHISKLGYLLLKLPIVGY